MMLNYDARGCPKFFNPSTRTIEERRALITCFLLGSVCVFSYETPVSCSRAQTELINIQDLILLSTDRVPAVDAIFR